MSSMYPSAEGPVEQPEHLKHPAEADEPAQPIEVERVASARDLFAIHEELLARGLPFMR